MKRWTAILTLLFAAFVVLCPKTSSAQDGTDGKRKVTSKINPEYPDMARRMNIKGIVKVDVTVGSNGVVKTVEVKGGHPVLAQAAVVAVRKWKWEPAAHDTKEPIEVKFNAEE